MITENIDVAQVVLYVFWIFFVGLIYWLRREDRREGYPLETDNPRKVGLAANILIPPPKTFLRPDGSEYRAPNAERDLRPMKSERTAAAAGSTHEPVGDPLLSGVGPASFTEREKHPELTREGHIAIVPLRADESYDISAGPDPRGWDVVGADGEVAGTVKDLWVDRAEMLVRYVEVELPAEGEDAAEGAAAEAKKRVEEEAAAKKAEEEAAAEEEASEEEAAEEEADEAAAEKAEESDEAADEKAEDEGTAEEEVAADEEESDEAADEDESDEDADEEESDEAADEDESDEAEGADEDESAEEEAAEAPVSEAPVSAPMAARGTRLVPIQTVLVQKRSRSVQMEAVKAAQLAHAPTLASAEQVTLDEEERVVAFFAGARLYADPKNLGPVV
ncbi:MAG TPA: photosynthetic reaction center subunit H [Polyangiaceae bacterium LLY-WYZ-15_(1-7)]|nr:hypothetical protein [Myxococcales bacterium]MAT24491.1 hypothetical protein [Sandaracinus sp.]HJL04137.1 photosynthetic reaction center subunit H [Polyangiaceae bacterium LLY-WYZ-15_(1-7)]